MPKGKQFKKTVEQSTVTGTVTYLKIGSTADKILQFLAVKKNQLLLIIAITGVFYANSITNEFTFDDLQFYTQNQYVLKGVNGIYDLFTKESMSGFYGHATSLSGGRWRPLTLITFALEKDYTGANPHISHFINLLLLVITGIIMLLFLRKYVFKSNPVEAFLVVLLFIIHPIHTDAVSHVKSRDEMLSWLFLLLTLFCSLNFITNKKNYWQLVFAVVFYLLALLSKENGLTFIVILPLSFYFFTKEKWVTILLATLPFALVLGGYLLIRFAIVSTVAHDGISILYAPYLYATPVQHIATALMWLGKYVALLLWPNPLSCDYSYMALPYANFSDWQVWVSVLAQVILIVYALLKIKEKNLVSYGILFYFCSIFMVSNFIVDVGTFLGERFLYQPSFGFCIAIVAIADVVLSKVKLKNTTQKFSIVAVLLSVVILLSGFQTIKRNTEWNNNMILFSTDVKAVPASFVMRESLGNIFKNDGNDAKTPQERTDDFNRALGEYDTAAGIYPKYLLTWYNIGHVNLQLGNTARATGAFLKSLAIDSNYSSAYMGLGAVCYNEKKIEQALTYFNKTVQLDSVNPLAYFDMALCYHMLGQYDNEIRYYKEALAINPPPDEIRSNPIDLDRLRSNLSAAETLLQNKKR